MLSFMSRYIIGVLNEFLLNKKANERMHAIGSPFHVAHKARKFCHHVVLDSGRPNHWDDPPFVIMHVWGTNALHDGA